MTTLLHQYDRNRGLSRTIACQGDSLTNGTGSTNGLSYPTQLGLLLGNNRLVSNFGIGGQTSAQIAARQGGTPSLLSLTGGAFNGLTPVTVSAMSVQLLSTPADDTTRYMSGMLSGIPCYLTRTASGGPPSTTETYTVTPITSTTAPIANGTPFYPDDNGFNVASFIQLLWLGRNDVPVLGGVSSLIDSCIAAMSTPRRFLVLGVLNAQNEQIGSANYNAIVAQNADALSKWPDYFVPTTPPTAAEMAAIGYVPTAQDLIDIANGIFPASMHFDNVHLNNIGYSIIALRCVQKIGLFNW